MHLYSYVLVLPFTFFLSLIIDIFFYLEHVGPLHRCLFFFFTYKEMVTPRSQAFPPPVHAV